MKLPPFIYKVSKKISSRYRNPYKQLGLNRLKISYLLFLKLFPDGKEHTVSFLNKKFNFKDSHEFLHCTEEIFSHEIYKQDLGENPYIIDCGAYIGFSVIYLKNKFPSAVIDAFEPDAANFALLQKNIKSFDLSGVRLHQKAVWKEDAKLNFSSDGNMASRIDGTNQTQIKNEIEAVRLKDYLGKKVDFLKIDIEGAEYEVLKDIAPLLFNVKNLFLEYHGSFNQNFELLEMLEIVKNAGFIFYIKEAAPVFDNPFTRKKVIENPFDLQLNIFCMH